MKALPWFVIVCAITLVGHVYIASSNQTNRMKQELELSEKARRIESDQVRDLMFVLQEKQNDAQNVASRNFVAGAIDAMQRKDHYDKIWHAGYDRGTEVQRLADATKPPYPDKSNSKELKVGF